MIKEWKIYDKEEEAVKSEEKAKKLVPLRFHKWIHVFGKKASERMLIKNMWDYAIKLKKEFVPRKEKIYFLFRKEREEVYESTLQSDTHCHPLIQTISIAL